MKIGVWIQLPNDKTLFEVIAVRGASIKTQSIPNSGVHWIQEDDLPWGTIVHLAWCHRTPASA